MPGKSPRLVRPERLHVRAMCDFPQFSSFWVSAAGSRERQRLACRNRLGHGDMGLEMLKIVWVCRLTAGRSYKHLAAFMIQCFFRSLRKPSKVARMRAVSSSEEEPPAPPIVELSGRACSEGMSKTRQLMLLHLPHMLNERELLVSRASWDRHGGSPSLRLSAKADLQLSCGHVAFSHEPSQFATLELSRQFAQFTACQVKHRCPSRLEIPCNSTTGKS